MIRPAAAMILAFLLTGCSNNPFGDLPEGKVFITASGGDIRTLDPSRVGDTASNAVASNIHDTPFEYHYLKRPLQLIPSMATDMPHVAYEDFNGTERPVFSFSIKKGLRYADDECFPGGKGREIKIDDIMLSVKRAADTAADPFGYPLLTGKVVGFDDYSAKLDKARSDPEVGRKVPESGAGKEKLRQAFLSDMEGLIKTDDYSLKLVLTDNFPQIIYFFSLTIGSPVPLECYLYYDGHNGRPVYDRKPVASGPFYIKEWKQNYRVVLAKNPNYRKDDFFPTEGMPGDEAEGLLAPAGKQLPLVDEVHMYNVQAGPTIWTLFEQGYLDRAGIPREVFDQVIQDQGLSDHYRSLGIRLDKDIDVSTYWWYFNLKDPLFKNNVHLRRAVSLAVDRDEIIARFNNGRGLPAHGIIPPGIEGYEEDFRNPYSRYDLKEAERLLVKAGYPGGIDPATGRPLRITLTMVASPQAASLYRFYTDQLAKINIDLRIEEVDWPTVLEKKNQKNFQMIHGGWHADYPDPQNFFQLFYGPNVNSTYNENSYQNPEFDELYRRIRSMEPGPERQVLLRRMNEITAQDAHVVFLFHPVTFGLSHQWVTPLRTHPINTNQLKYRDTDPELRSSLTKKWNTPPVWAYILLGAVFLSLAAGIAAAVRQYRNIGS